MALSLDDHVVNSDLENDLFHLSLDFVGTLDSAATNVDQCSTSSGWSECIVNAYHLCAQQQEQWWNYTTCMYRHQYPPVGSTSRIYLECGGMNPLRNEPCSRSQFPEVVRNISTTCAREASINAGAVEKCAEGELGLRLLKESMSRSAGFPKSLFGKVEPQWILVDSPTNCTKAEGGWVGCKKYLDKTKCEDWNHCDSDEWALHIRDRVVGGA